MCYTSDLQTSSIFTVEYYKGVAKSAAEAGAHMIGIKVAPNNYRPVQSSHDHAGRSADY